jgi:NifB/MoaA-like Fe-S oxidoreductase
MNREELQKEFEDLKATGELFMEKVLRLQEKIGGTDVNPSQRSGLNAKQITRLKRNRRRFIKQNKTRS